MNAALVLKTEENVLFGIFYVSRVYKRPLRRQWLCYGFSSRSWLFGKADPDWLKSILKYNPICTFCLRCHSVSTVLSCITTKTVCVHVFVCVLGGVLKNNYLSCYTRYSPGLEM